MASGDFNNNGTVEQADLDLVLLNWGAEATPPPTGWLNNFPSGLIDQQELDAVLVNWGNTSAEATAVTVPEPSTTVLLVAAAMMLATPLRQSSILTG
jgi:hypothetical protein